tara:strand:- start:107 stop:457 length:351 start_codon:yes stop_codon:yes gene_type:complete
MNNALIVLIYLLINLICTYVLWGFYLATMNIKRAKDNNLLTKRAKILALPILVIAYILDCLVNWFVMTIVLFELPKEILVTQRLKRHNNGSDSWRTSIAVWIEPLLDPFDPTGDHI